MTFLSHSHTTQFTFLYPSYQLLSNSISHSWKICTLYSIHMQMFHSHVIKFHSYTILHSIHSMSHFHEISIPSILLSSLVPRPSTPNVLEGLVKLVCRMTSGGRLEMWHFRWTAVLCMHGAISHASRHPPNVILRTSFTRPSTALGDRRPGNEAISYLFTC